MYEDVAGTPLPDPLRRALGKPWAAHIRVKADLYGALTRLHQADVFIADDECGEQISCLQVQLSRASVIQLRFRPLLSALQAHRSPSADVASSFSCSQVRVPNAD